MSFSERTKAFMTFALRATGRAAAIRADLIFATSTPLTIALPGIYAAYRGRAPFVFEVRDLWPELPIAMGALKHTLSIAAATRLEVLAYCRAHHIVALSPDMKQGIIERGVEPQRVTVIPNSCDFDLFDVPPSEGKDFRREHDWLGERPLVVYCGTVGRINGVDYLAHLAAAMLRNDPDVRFLVVGRGSEQGRIRRYAEALGVLDRNFFMIGGVPKRDIPTILSAADIATSLFIDLPAMWANSANKFFDALAAGRPVAINHEGWLADLVRQRGLGLVLDPRNVAESAAALARYLNDDEAMRRAREASRRVGRELFDRDVLASRLEDVLLSAAGAGRTLDTMDTRRSRQAA
jgi:glycosyltransferase involved in cell wall biosynthesis